MAHPVRFRTRTIRLQSDISAKPQSICMKGILRSQEEHVLDLRIFLVSDKQHTNIHMHTHISRRIDLTLAAFT